MGAWRTQHKHPVYPVGFIRIPAPLKMTLFQSSGNPADWEPLSPKPSENPGFEEVAYHNPPIIRKIGIGSV